jgi:hypothetical protein
MVEVSGLHLPHTRCGRCKGYLFGSARGQALRLHFARTTNISPVPMTSFLCFSCIDAADKGVVQVPPSTPHVTRHSRCASLLDVLRLPAVIHVGCSGLAAALLARFLFGSVSLRLQLKHGLTGMRQVQRPRRPRMLVPPVAHAGTYRAVPTASLQPTDTIIFPARLQTVTPVSMQTRQLDVMTYTKTSHNVTVSV